MKSLWYSDNRDLIKWATLAHIAQEHRLRAILQAPYLRPEISHPHFSFQENRIPISPDVWSFFRNIHDVKRLTSKLGISINVVAAEFNPQEREAYVEEVKIEINQCSHPLLLFLDPDTGLEPSQIKPEHTSKKELDVLWRTLKPKDWLVLYQHARRTHDWVESVREQLSSLCKCKKRGVHISRSENLGKDVAFFCIEKID